ncbi:hypothetical protein BC940DRAFT_296767 [Gongronella butleri]|nr:hypothetical protein BC940DRAFT_296767 [Gongronella butleri]
MWNSMRVLIGLLENSWIRSAHTGVRLAAFKCLQTLITLETRKEKADEDQGDIFNVSMIRPNHRLLNLEQLEDDGKRHLDLMLDQLTGEERSMSVLSAIISILPTSAQLRSQLTRIILGALVTLGKKASANFDSWASENLQKCIKLAIASMIRFDRLSVYRPELIGAYSMLGGNPSQIRWRNGNDDIKRKRAYPGDTGDRKERRPRLEDRQQARVKLNNVDASHVPTYAIVDLCVAILQSASFDIMTERINMIPESILAVDPAIVESAMDASTIQDIPEEIKLAQEDIEAANDFVDDSTPTNSTPLAPSETVPIPAAADVQLASSSGHLLPSLLPTDDEQLSWIKSSLERVLAIDQLNDNPADDAAGTVAKSAMGVSYKAFWIKAISKLFTQATSIGLDIHPTNSVESDVALYSVKSEDSKMEVHEMLAPSDDKNAPLTWLPDIQKRANLLKEILLSFVSQDFSSRYELALAWLDEERYAELHQETSQIANGDVHGYYYWLLRLLDSGFHVVEHKDKSIVKLLLAAPALNETIVEKISQIMQDQPNRFVMCVSALRDLATYRPSIRSQCLSALLAICMDTDVKARSTAIAAVKRWVPEHALAEDVKQFSVQSASKLIDSAKGSVIDPEQAASGDTENQNTSTWSEKAVSEHLDLFLALCTKDHDLLKELFVLYTQMDSFVQQCVRQNIDRIVSSIGIESSSLVGCIRNYPAGSETLALRVLKILCTAAPVTIELQSLIKELYIEKRLRAKFMLPILQTKISQ